MGLLAGLPLRPCTGGLLSTPPGVWQVAPPSMVGAHVRHWIGARCLGLCWDLTSLLFKYALGL